MIIKSLRKSYNYSFFFNLFTQWKNLYLLSDLPVICIWLLIIQNINSQFYVELFVCILFKRFYKVIHTFNIYYRLTSLLSHVWYLDYKKYNKIQVFKHFPMYHMKILLQISIKNWGDSIFSNQQQEMRVHMRIVMIMVLK
jgi:hypothetical protein